MRKRSAQTENIKTKDEFSLCLKSIGLGRIELPTLRLSGVHSKPLSYKPDQFQCAFFVQIAQKKGGAYPKNSVLLFICHNLIFILGQQLASGQLAFFNIFTAF